MADEKFVPVETRLEGSEHHKELEPEALKLLVSFSDVSFSSFDNGYYEVLPGVYFSTLLYILYVNDAKAGNDFENAKNKARKVLIDNLEKKRKTLIRTSRSLKDSKTARIVKRKIQLIMTAISFLESQES
jgi:hypothetical protein